MNKIKKVLLFSTALCSSAVGVACASGAWAQSAWEEGPPVSVNDMGSVGLVHMRTARFFDDGHFEFGNSFSNPFRKYYFTWQIMPRVETTFRYTDITNRPLQIQAIPQSESRFWSDLIGLHDRNSYLDRTFDVKFLLSKETNYFPQLAFGLQDFLGTGIFSGEFLVASKRFGNFDFTLGLGWGQYASRSAFGNPLKFFGSHFDERERSRGQGGQFNVNNFFSGGKAGLFGGVEYATPIKGLSLKAEYDTDDPDVQARRGLSVLPGRLPFNFGAVYQPVSWFSMNVGLMRGHAPVVGFAFRTNFNEFGLPKKDAPPPVVIPRSVNRRDIVFSDNNRSENALNRNWVSEIGAELKSQNVIVSYVVFEKLTAFVQVRTSAENKPILNDLNFISRIFSTLPKSIDTLALTYSENNQSKVQYYFRSIKHINEGLEKLDEKSIVLNQVIQSGTTTYVSLAALPEKEKTENTDIDGFVSLFGRSDRVFLKSEADDILISPLFLKAQRQAEDFMFKLAAAGISPKSVFKKDQKLELEAPILQPNQITARETVAALALDWGVKSVQFRDFQYKFDEVKGLTLTNEELQDLLSKVSSELGKQFIAVYSLDIKGKEAIIYSVGTGWPQVPRFIGRATRGMANVLPPEIEVLTVVEIMAGIETSRTSLMRSDVEKMSNGNISPVELFNNAKFSNGSGSLKGSNSGAVNEGLYPAYSWYAVPKLQQNIGDPNEGIYNADLDLSIGGNFAFAPGFSASVVINQKLMGDLDQIKRGSDSVLPHVRSDIVQYLKSGDTTLARLEASYFTALSPEWYFRASAGIFEQMYGGVASEVLYKPFDKPWALGFDLAWVKQRGFDQLFKFRDYQIVTGFVSLYYDLPFWDMRAIVKAGRYLAGDRGVTIDLSRQFKSGVRVGAFSTFTNVSAKDFGEGSFDKGFYINFPMELFLQNSSRESASFVFKPITRDGGQVAASGGLLYGLVKDRGYREIKKTWGTIFK